MWGGVATQTGATKNIILHHFGIYPHPPVLTDTFAPVVRVRRKNVVRKELQVQLNLIEEIDSFTSLDAESIKALRARIGAIKIKTPVRAKLKAPAALTNQTLFEQYRRMVESDLKSQAKFQAEPRPHPYLFALSFMGYWMARYSRRLQTINGSYGRVADEQGQRALVARNRARDLAEMDRPDWTPRCERHWRCVSKITAN